MQSEGTIYSAETKRGMVSHPPKATIDLDLFHPCSDLTTISPSSRAFIAITAAWAPAAVVK
mgnify:CR=1 FL=1